MISYIFGYGYGLRSNRGAATLAISFGAIRSADGSPIASGNGSILTF